MVGPTLRLEAIARAGADPTTGVLLLDVVLGYGAQPDPAQDLVPVLHDLPDDLPVVISCIGTDDDPQVLSRQGEALAATGAQVFCSNAHAARQAVSLLAVATEPEGGASR